MGDKHSYRVPEFIVCILGENKPLDGNDMNEIENILDHSLNYSYPVLNTDKAWNRFASGLETPMTVVKRPVRFAMFRWVAAAIVVLTLGLGMWQYVENKNATFSASFHPIDLKISQSLPDGSRFILNTGGELVIKAIGPSKREIELKSGEVFLNVANHTVPFRVITPKGVITVLGTEFSVSRKPGSPFSIYLKKGSIQFESSGEKIIMHPGDYLLEDKNGDFIISRISDNRTYAWTSGKLSFNNTTLKEVIKGLETVYSTSFVYDATLENEKITVSFENLSAEQAAELLTKTLNSKVSVK